MALGDKRSSKVVGRAIEDIDLPPGTTIPAVVRGEDVIIAHHDTVIHERGSCDPVRAGQTADRGR